MLILIEYKPPSIENLNYLLKGGHASLNKIKDFYLNFTDKSENIE